MFAMFTSRPIFGPVNRAILSTETPVAILHRASSPCQSSLHAFRSEFSHVSQHCREILFPFGYVLSFTFSDGAHGVS